MDFYGKYQECPGFYVFSPLWPAFLLSSAYDRVINKTTCGRLKKTEGGFRKIPKNVEKMRIFRKNTVIYNTKSANHMIF
jgi:hypothetical protein